MPHRENYLIKYLEVSNKSPIFAVQKRFAMISKNKCIEQLKACKEQLVQKFGVSSMLLFGSVARNEQNESSDVDVFVDMKPNLLLLVGVKQFLEEKLGCSVDVIRNHRRIDNYLMQQIQKDGVEIFK